MPITGPRESRPFVQISMDLMTDLPPSKDGYDTLLVVLDHGLSKGAVLIPTVKTVTTTGMAELLKDNVFQHYRLPETLISDRDPHFTSTVFQEWLKLLGIKSAMSTTYHPQMDSATERLMQEIQAYLLIYCIANPTNWTSAIPMLKFVHNSQPHADRKQSPFELIMGYQPKELPQTMVTSRVLSVEEQLRQLEQ